MKKEYAKIFDHYYGLQYDNNVSAMIRVHELMEQAEITPYGSTKNKLDAYSDRRPFKVHYFISRVGKNLKWCPTNSKEKLDKMTLKPAEWWIEQLTDTVTPVARPVINIPADWLEQQAEAVRAMVFAKKVVTKENHVSTITAKQYEDLPF
jgi:hypothetical protein